MLPEGGRQRVTILSVRHPILLFTALSLPLLAGTAELDGTKIEYSAAGKGQTAIVLIHGWTCDRTLWDAQVDALKARYRVVAVDLPGHGVSGAAPDYSMRRFARAVEAVMRAEKIERAVLAGHSMGGAVMMEFARLFPGKAAAIIAVDAIMPSSADAAVLPEVAARFQGPDAMATREKMVRGMFTPATTPEMRAKIERVMLGTAAETAAGAMKGIAEPEVWRDDVIDVPLLQITAATNNYVTEEGLKRRFPRTKLVQVPGTGHFLHMEKPSEVNSIMLGWLREQGL